MISIKKFGKNVYGNWCIFSYEDDYIQINGIASTKLELEENHSYANLKLVINSKNGKTYYNLLKNE